MSGYTQNENVSRGSDTMIDRYCNSLNILKEKVMFQISPKIHRYWSNSIPRCDGFLSCMKRCNNLFLISLSTSSKYPSNNKKHWEKLGVNPDQKPGFSTTYREVETGVRSLIRVPNHRIAGKTSGSSSEAYVQPKPLNIRYNPRMYDGGLLPRLNYTDKQVVLPEHKPRDFWSPHRAHFGQNDYIDILGDGKIKPRDFYTGPPWVLGTRNEYQRVCSRLNNPAIVAWMEEFEPSKLTAEYKLQRYLFKKVNKRKNIKFERYRDSP